MRFTITVVALLLAAATSADPVVTAIIPNTGSVTGGEKVIVKGRGFSNICITCSPPFADPRVWFLETEAASVKLIDAETLEVVTPPHLPGTVTVRVHQLDGSNAAYLQNGFMFVGDPNEGFDPILFPIFVGPVRGAFGSEFHTTARIWNESHDFTTSVPLYGVDTSCTLIDPPIDPLFPFYLVGSGPEAQLIPGCSQSVGRLFWVPKGRDTLAANLRVADVTRQAQSLGAEIPVVHRRDFSDRRVSLLGVPIDPRYRNTLRVYSLARGEVPINLQIGEMGRQIVLPPAADWFAPAFATVTDFPLPHELPAGQKTIRVTVDSPNQAPIWAFITVTNNDTQQITTITPN